MSLRSPGNYRDDFRHSQFRALLDCPFHAIELEDRQKQGDVRSRRRLNLFSEFELHFAVADVRHFPPAHDSRYNNVEFLPDTSAQDANEMVRMIARKESSILRNFVSNPSSPRHDLKCKVREM